MSTGHSVIDITVDDPRTLDETLTAAVSQLVQAGKGCTHGILVTRQGLGRYTAELSDAVPYGVVHEATE